MLVVIFKKEEQKIPKPKSAMFSSSKHIAAYIGQFDDMMSFKRKPIEINKKNDCKWFYLYPIKWYNFKKRKRFKERYEAM